MATMAVDAFICEHDAFVEDGFRLTRFNEFFSMPNSLLFTYRYSL